MGGIVGFIDHSMDESDLNHAIDAMHHRGSDDRGIYLSENSNVGLGHINLSIQDPTGSKQPFYANAGGLVLVCNGEIYEFELIREKLSKQGHSFYTRNDSEVILHLYMEYGLNFVDHLRGEYSFLLYDKFENTLLAVRDHFGLKPLFYCETSQGYLFASEAKALFSTGKITPKIDAFAVKNILKGVAQESIFESVMAVPPGHIMSISLCDKKHTLTRYWGGATANSNTLKNCIEEDNFSVKFHVNKVRKAFEYAVKIRLRSDVPIGVYVSGQKSCTLVAETMMKYRRSRLKAFYASFPDDTGFERDDSVQSFTGNAGVSMHSIVCGHQTLLASIEDCVWATEQPIASLHAVGMYLLSKYACKHVKVAVTSSGASDVFPECFQSRESLGLSLPIQKNDEYCKKKGVLDYLYKYAPVVKMLHRSSLENFAGDSFNDDKKFISRLDVRQEMASSIEGRIPFLDVHLVETVQKIPFKIRRKVLQKAFLKKKSLFSFPPLLIGTEKTALFDDLVKTYLSRDRVESTGFFSFDEIQSQLHELSSPLSSKMEKQKLSQKVILILTVHILDQFYVKKFKENLMNRSKLSIDNRDTCCENYSLSTNLSMA